MPPHVFGELFCNSITNLDTLFLVTGFNSPADEIEFIEVFEKDQDI